MHCSGKPNSILQFISASIEGSLPKNTASLQGSFQPPGRVLKNYRHTVTSLCSRVEHAAVGLAALILALCQQGKVPQQARQFAEEASSMAETAITTSVVATSFVAPALAETRNFDASTQQPSPPPLSASEIRK